MKQAKKYQNVGIVTFYRSNYGGFLQAYALSQTMQRLGYTAELIQYDDRHDHAICGVPLAYLRTPLRFGKTLAVAIIRSCKRRASRKCFDESARQTLRESPRYSSVRKLSQNLPYDMLLTGSDQVFNPCLAPQGYRLRMLDFNLPAVRKASYAASVGLEAYPKSHQETFRRCLSDFYAVSVREKAAVPLVQQFTDKPVIQHVDPTFLLTKADWQRFSQALPPEAEQRFVFVYMLQRQPELIAFAQKMARHLGCKILFSDERNIFEEAIPLKKPLSPQQFINAVLSARYVVTNSFHGTVLSIQFNQRVKVFLPDTAPVRIADVISSYKLERLYQDEIIQQNEVENMFSFANGKMEQEREAAKRYLLSLGEA